MNIKHMGAPPKEIRYIMTSVLNYAGYFVASSIPLI